MLKVKSEDKAAVIASCISSATLVLTGMLTCCNNSFVIESAIMVPVGLAVWIVAYYILKKKWHTSIGN